MKLLKYICKRQKLFFIPILIVVFLGIILIHWGIDVNNQVIKNAILVSIGTSLLASGIVAFLDIICKAVQNQIFENIDNIVIKAGIDNIYSKRDLDEYDTLIKNVHNSIDVAGYSLRGFFQSYKDILLEKITQNKNLKIRILLVDPKSAFSTSREMNEDGFLSGTYASNVNIIKNGFKNIENISIKTIQYPFSHMIYRIDDTMFVGPYFYKKSSKSTNTTKLNRNGQLFSAYQQEFDDMWEDGQPI